MFRVNSGSLASRSEQKHISAHLNPQVILNRLAPPGQRRFVVATNPPLVGWSAKVVHGRCIEREPPELASSNKGCRWCRPNSKRSPGHSQSDPLEARRLLQIDSSKRVEHLTIARRDPSLERRCRPRFDRREHFQVPRQNEQIAFASTVTNTSRCPDRTKKSASHHDSEPLEVPRPNEQNPVNVPKKRHSFDPMLASKRPDFDPNLASKSRTFARFLALSLSD